MRAIPVSTPRTSRRSSTARSTCGRRCPRLVRGRRRRSPSSPRTRSASRTPASWSTRSTRASGSSKARACRQPQRDIGRRAIIAACGELRRRLLADEGELPEAAVDDLVLTGDGVQIVGVPHVVVTLVDLASRAPAERDQVSESFDPPAASTPTRPTPASSRSRRHRSGALCGTWSLTTADAANPRTVEGQVHGAVARTSPVPGRVDQYSDSGERRRRVAGPPRPDRRRGAVFHRDPPDDAFAVRTAWVSGCGEAGMLAPGAVIANAIRTR